MSEQEVNERVKRQVERACLAIRQHAADVAEAAGRYTSSLTITIEIDPDKHEAEINYDLDAWGIPDPPRGCDLSEALAF